MEQFSCYPKLQWSACAEGRSVGIGDKIDIYPDIENFKLERFRDLRKDPIPKDRLVLRGSSKTLIFIGGSDELLNEVMKRLPKYVGKFWAEINRMKLEQDFLTCNNAFGPVCSEWLRKNIELKELKPGREVQEIDLNKADEICSKCEFYDHKVDVMPPISR